VPPVAIVAIVVGVFQLSRQTNVTDCGAENLAETGSGELVHL